MKQIQFVTILLFFISNFGFSQTQKKMINGVVFKIVTISNDAEQTETVVIYRNDKKLLTHILSRFNGDCSSENIYNNKI